MSLTVAIPKGRLGSMAVNMLKASGMGSSIDVDSRRLVFDDGDGIRYILLKNSDVITYVERGAADIGISGKDMIMEKRADVYQLYSLGTGRCRLTVAGMKGGGEDMYRQDVIRVATKFPLSAAEYFEGKGRKIRLIRLNGSIELAPVLGLSDVIVDIVETGSTLEANGLEVYDDICDISASIISNKVSYKFKKDEIDGIISLLKKEDQKNDQNNR